MLPVIECCLIINVSVNLLPMKKMDYVFLVQTLSATAYHVKTLIYAQVVLEALPYKMI